MLFLFSEDDIQSSAAAAPRIVVGLLEFMLSLHCARALHLFTRDEGASGHCQMGGLSYARTVIFGWLNDVLRGKPLESDSDPAAAERIVRIFRHYGGAEGEARARAVVQVAQLV